MKHLRTTQLNGWFLACKSAFRKIIHPGDEWILALSLGGLGFTSVWSNAAAMLAAGAALVVSSVCIGKKYGFIRAVLHILVFVLFAYIGLAH